MKEAEKLKQQIDKNEERALLYTSQISSLEEQRATLMEIIRLQKDQLELYNKLNG